MEATTKKKGFFHARLSVKKDGPFRTYINILIGYIDTVVLMNFFFIGTSLGIVTIGPGLAAMYDVYEDIAENRNEHRYRAYFRHFKEEFNLPNVLVGLLSVLVMAGLSYAFYFFFLNVKSYIWFTIPMILSILLILYINRFLAYYFLQNSRLNLSFKSRIHNSFLLSIAYIKNLLLCDLGFAVLFLVPLIFIEYCFPLLIVITFSSTSLSCMMSIYSVVNKYALRDIDYDPAEIKETEPNLRLDLINNKKQETVKK